MMVGRNQGRNELLGKISVAGNMYPGHGKLGKEGGEGRRTKEEQEASWEALAYPGES